MAYSGTHETTKFGERDSGNTLIVEITEPGAAPGITRIRTGGLAWRVIEEEMRQPGDLANLRERLEALENPAATLLELRVGGLLSAQDRDELARIEEILTSRFLFTRIDWTHLRPSPSDDSWIAGLPVGPLREAATKLRELCGSSIRQPASGRRIAGSCVSGVVGAVCVGVGAWRVILRSIVVQGWRCFANPVSVGPFTEGLNVLHAPNAAGKSTLLKPLRLGLTGRAPGQQPFEILEDLVGYVATELNANPRDLDPYARRQPTLSAHLERVREHLGLTAFDEKARQRLAPFVFKEAFRLEQGTNPR